ncbi:MAG: hypothetical protein NTW92_04745 [Bacteroidetes bacterium]|jgi:hypothetical protein|nr:hypothetical protein [Bacteroidota bacterium]
MAKYLKITLSILMMSVIIISCKKDSPVDEDGLLITFRQECFVSNFELLGSDFVTVRAATAVIDTIAQTINVTVNPGTDLKNVYPQFSLATDCKLDPKIIGKTDLSNLTSPKIYTVVSGNRKIRKPYTLNIKF